MVLWFLSKCPLWGFIHLSHHSLGVIISCLIALTLILSKVWNPTSSFQTRSCKEHIYIYICIVGHWQTWIMQSFAKNILTIVSLMVMQYTSSIHLASHCWLSNSTGECLFKHNAAISPLIHCQVISRLCNWFSIYSKWLDLFWTYLFRNIHIKYIYIEGSAWKLPTQSTFQNLIIMIWGGRGY